jgi:hypothetical protein
MILLFLSPEVIGGFHLLQLSVDLPVLHLQVPNENASRGILPAHSNPTETGTSKTDWPATLRCQSSGPRVNDTGDELYISCDLKLHIHDVVCKRMLDDET